MDRRERLYLAAWAIGLWFFVISFAGLTMLDAYAVPDGMFNGLMFANIVLGILASQPPFYNFGERRREGGSPHPRVPEVMMAAGALLILSLPVQSLLGIESALWMRANTVAAGAAIVRLGQLLGRT